jgi:hypothetical protein
MYAEMPANFIPKQGSLLEVSKVYNIIRFRVAHAKSSHRVTNAPVMIYFTLYSIIGVCKKPASTFPLYAYEFNSYGSISPYGPKSKDFHGTILDIFCFLFLLLLSAIH